MTKKILFIALLLLGSMVALPAAAKTVILIKATLNDGKEVSGTLKKGNLNMFAKDITITDNEDNDLKLDADNIKRLIATDQETGKEGIYVSEYVTSRGMLGSKTSKEKCIVEIIYEGEKANCYIAQRWDTEVSGYGGSKVRRVLKPEYFYKAPGMDDIRSFYFAVGGVTVGGKAALKKFFKDYPAFVELIKNGEITYGDMQKSPADFIKRLDETLK